MRRVKTHRVLFAVVLAAALGGMGGGPSGLAAAATTNHHSGTLSASSPLTVVADGLYSPRNLAWGPHGRMLVAETGIPPLTSPSECNFVSEEIVFEMRCFGETGSIADVSSGTPRRIVTGLASNLNQQEMVGPNDLAYVDGKLYVLETGAPQAVPTWLSEGLQNKLKRQYGALLDVSGGSKRVVATPGSTNYDWMVAHPELATSDPSANLYAMAPKPGGGFYVVDAAANTLDLVDRRGRVHVLAFFPPMPNGSDAVPTCVDVGRDGSVYVGQLTGHGNSGEAGAKAANIYRYSPRSGELTVWQRGFSAVTGCGFGANGDFYVTQLSTTGFLPTGDPEGAVVQIAPNGRRTVLGEGRLFAPSGFLAGRDGSIYVANNTIWWPAGTTGEWDEGEIVKIG